MTKNQTIPEIIDNWYKKSIEFDIVTIGELKKAITQKIEDVQDNFIKRQQAMNDCYCDDLPENDEGLGFVRACDNCASLSLISDLKKELLGDRK